jgi:broad specificity phosphatase PhoE
LKITILRHGKPNFEWGRSVWGSDFKNLEHAYDSAGIVGLPPAETEHLALEHKLVVCSDLPRSLESARALGIDTVDISSETFREMNLPYFDYSPIKLPLKIWVVILRTLWFFGFSRNAESLGSAKKRAKTASNQLIQLASEHDSVLLVGHGFLNHYISKELRRKHWSGPKSPGKRYWEFGTYEQK